MSSLIAQSSHHSVIGEVYTEELRAYLACTISLAYLSAIPLLRKNCSPVKPVTSVNPTSCITSLKLVHGKTGLSYICKNLSTVSLINVLAFTGAYPYLQSSFAKSHHLPSLIVNSSSFPFHMPISGTFASSLELELSERLNVLVALTRIWLTSTKMEAPSSTGCSGSDHG